MHWFSFEGIRLQVVNSNSAFHLNRYRLIATYSGNINESRIQWIKDRSSFGLVGFKGSRLNTFFFFFLTMSRHFGK